MRLEYSWLSFFIMENQIEIWKDVLGYEGLYEVSNYGLIKSKQRVVTRKSKKGLIVNQLVNEVIKKSILDKDGYQKVCIWKNGKSKNVFVHRLVAIAFINNPENKPQVNHIDENKENNKYTNLEWSTSLENIRHGTGIERSRISSSKPVVQFTLDGVFIKEYKSVSDTKNFGFCFQGVHNCCINKIKHYKKFVWKFKTDIV